MQASQAALSNGPDLREQIVLALGAGVYEELVFRLYLIAGLMLLFESGFQLRKKHSAPLAIGLSAIVFAACHFSPIGSEAFGWRPFLMLVIAGAYLGVVFSWRGLGVAAGCHAAFNLISLVWGRWYG
jgi:membrane protease YdiL (CAAX protease family)